LSDPIIQHPPQHRCPINRAIKDTARYTCRHRDECPIEECEHCLIDKKATYDKKMKWIEWVEDLLASQDEMMKYNPILPRLDRVMIDEHCLQVCL
jgi:hypothetical protein